MDPTHGTETVKDATPSSVIHVASADQLREILNTTKSLVFVDFYATWCGPCIRIHPTIEKWASSEFSDVTFVRVNVDELKTVTADYHIRAVPTFQFFKNGVFTSEIVGANLAAIHRLLNLLHS
eukprot:gnl/Dysnectes_brevis/1604_a1817_2841.p1 GENE.gnl/Dysnectes_brevis/1604_a1817_2841~~gnl/Dysnectes_brevis/1604_a1817_2841.p1  ORF type:complete len:123 (+),score=3.91 gnl/Dysnectes_brevis/1604_a1817_2841:72-440(+)